MVAAPCVYGSGPGSGVPRPFDPGKLYDPGDHNLGKHACFAGPAGYDLGVDVVSSSAAVMWAASAVRRIRGVQRARRHVFAFDGCCGTATSQTLFHLATNRYSRVIGCDRDKPEKWVRKHIPLEFQKRFVFISKDRQTDRQRQAELSRQKRGQKKI